MIKFKTFNISLATLSFALMAVLLSSCSGNKGTFTILSGSENKPLEPIVTRYCQRQGWDCVFDYKGSVDIMLALRAGETSLDAVWPAHSRWIDLGDKRRQVKHTQSIMRSPVVLAMTSAEQRRLGFDRSDVTTRDILDAVRSRQLQFLMTSATQSNSGFSAYMAMLTALSGSDLVSAETLDQDFLKDELKTLLSGVARSSGSSGWLADLYLEASNKAAPYKAMWNYEAVIIDTNKELERRRQEPLQVIYPSDGVAIADSPLGFLAKPNEPGREEFFLDLQKHLLSQNVQTDLAKLGRRTGLASLQAGLPKQVFKPDWGIDTARVLQSITFPSVAVIEQALDLYQKRLRKPSLLALCLDYSGSMNGGGEQQMELALKRLFSQSESERLLLSTGHEDQMFFLPFASQVQSLYTSKGAIEARSMIRTINAKHRAEGGTDIYACAREAMRRVAEAGSAQDFTRGVILMTDGRSDGSYRNFQRDYRRLAQDIPVFGITFGDADDSQLKDLASLTLARVFDGRSDLMQAFRKAKGYN